MFLLRPLSPGFEASLAGLTDATIVLHAVRAWDARRPAGAPRELAAADIAFDDHDQTQIVTSFPIAPLGDGRDLVVEMTNARPVHARALEVASALLWSTIATGALVALLTLLFFQRYLLRPLRGIASRLVEIGHGGDAAARLPPPARADEIGTVTDAANEMLGQLEEAKRGADSARDAAVTANRIKSDFLARMSHEIRTPMNGVLGMTELLTRTDLSARQRKFADTIHRSAVSLLEIINDILDFSKIEAKRLELSPSLAEPGNLVEEVLELLAPRAHARGLEFVLEITPAVPTVVEIDRVRIGQVLTNLVGNAIKFTEQGEIAVKVDATSCGDGRASIAFTVRDTGIGIEAAALQRIFEPFSQADASTTQRFGGTGLGLPIARQLVELMGGTLSVVSEPSRGSTFSFNIVVPVQPDRRAPGECDLPLLRDINILVADPNASCRDILQRQLTAQGARVVVSDGADLQAAAAALAGAPLHVALVDPGHPSAGRGLLEAVLSIPAFDAASIIAIASHADTVAGIEATGQPRLAAYLTKPVRRSLLFTTLARLIGREREVATRALLGGGGGAASAESIGLNVLVVEDNLVNQQVTVGMLQLLSCTSTVAANGAEALERIAAGGFDVVLMDCQMPVLDGIEATRRLRADEAARRARRLPVIGVSAHAVQSAHEDCLRAGMTDFIPKPFTLAELSRALKRHAHQRPISLALKTGGR
jgi:signal transduction histidine kinase/CheY-like chemotaxis protein